MARNDYQLFRYNPQDGILGSFFSFAGFLCLFEFIIWLMILWRAFELIFHVVPSLIFHCWQSRVPTRSGSRRVRAIWATTTAWPSFLDGTLLLRTSQGTGSSLVGWSSPPLSRRRLLIRRPCCVISLTLTPWSLFTDFCLLEQLGEPRDFLAVIRTKWSYFVLSQSSQWCRCERHCKLRFLYIFLENELNSI